MATAFEITADTLAIGLAELSGSLFWIPHDLLLRLDKRENSLSSVIIRGRKYLKKLWTLASYYRTFSQFQAVGTLTLNWQPLEDIFFKLGA